MRTDPQVIEALGTYAPTWTDAGGSRCLGPDEDVTTMAVEAARAVPGFAASAGRVDRVVLVTRKPDHLLGTVAEVVLAALGLAPGTPFEERVGGAPEVLELLASAVSGTLVLAIDPGAPAVAGAALMGEGACRVELHRAVRHSLPVRSRAVGDRADLVYDDTRLLREHGWRRALTELDPSGAVGVAGIPARDAMKLVRTAVHVSPSAGPASAIAVLTDMVRGGVDGDVVGVENGHAVLVSVAVLEPASAGAVLRDPIERRTVRPPTTAAAIPASLASYERAFDAKVGFVGRACTNGHVTFPPRPRCLECHDPDLRDVPLPRQGRVYTLSTVRAPVPGKDGPYTLAVVALDDSHVRVLAHVTDATPGRQSIDDHGALVLRRVAVRAGIPDYGYAFQPDLPSPGQSALDTSGVT